MFVVDPRPIMSQLQPFGDHVPAFLSFLLSHLLSVFLLFLVADEEESLLKRGGGAVSNSMSEKPKAGPSGCPLRCLSSLSDCCSVCVTVP